MAPTATPSRLPQRRRTPRLLPQTPRAPAPSLPHRCHHAAVDERLPTTTSPTRTQRTHQMTRRKEGSEPHQVELQPHGTQGCQLSSGLPCCSGSTLHLHLLTLSTLSVLGPLMAVAIEHLLPTQVVPYWWGLGDQPHPRIPLANHSLLPMRYFLQGWIKQCFLLKVVCQSPRV